LKSKEVPFSSLGIEGIFFILSLPLSLSLLYTVMKKLEREPERPPKSMDTLS
jgi:hypothetical protein